MSDFTSPFWSYWITAIAVGGVIFCIAILISQMMAKTNKPGEENLQPHVWDDTLQEYNNPMPRWWLFMFVGTIIFGVVYFWVYPALGNNKGTFAWSSQGEYEAETAKLENQVAPIYAQFLSTPIEQLAENKEAMALGQRLFLNNCAQCHGADGGGSKGFPNLTDSDWLYGGWPQNIERSIMGGRNGVMTPQADALKTPVAVNDVANYVLSLSNTPHDAVAAARGKDKFTLCASCHMVDGKGAISDQTGAQRGVGAPNLTDKTWLYGGDIKTITETITKGRNNVMPAWACFLGEARVHVLAAYVWQLNRDENGKVLNPTQAPEYLAKFAAEDKAAWDMGKTEGIKRGVPECQGISVHMQKAWKAEADEAAAAQAAKPAEAEIKK
ncbi:cytochrome-c oxidase, cbb3-type subunit III [Hydromonas duriensis]|uniref:Cytochrome c oxidase subunit III n=1 Tax=Hydromonas duriensis TaxID=1527608 RepID=A0A4R6YBW0_9BURK|nr:cytochrome c oxidase cbb3-type subunit 3 [Hydromonas duriensis]